MAAVRLGGVGGALGKYARMPKNMSVHTPNSENKNNEEEIAINQSADEPRTFISNAAQFFTGRLIFTC